MAKTDYEKVPVEILETSEQASKTVADCIAALIRERAAEGRKAVLGLATGSTPTGVYRELIRMHKEEGLDFSNVLTFNLDEYYPMAPDAIQSYHRWMHENLFDHVNVPAENIHIPDGTLEPSKVDAFCEAYEKAISDAGGIDIQLLGIGRTGHIGFNEPGSGRESRTRMVYLDRVTRGDAASDFFGEENVPRQAITMGVGSIMAARKVFLLAFGEHKASIIRRAVEGEISNTVAASFLQEHPSATFYLDASAAGMLTRQQLPWLVGSCEWDEMMTRRAVVWLAAKQGKTILSLTDEDYAENHLYELLLAKGGSYNINLEVFKRLMNTISGWPGGKSAGKKVIVFSPHPDDDVISMGATLAKLAQQGHEVHTAYQTSGNLAVFDHNVLQFADFVREFNGIFGLASEQTAVVDDHIEQFLANKKPAQIDSDEVQKVKALIRRVEAVAAAGFCGVPQQRCHFLDLPFYQTGTVKKMPIAEEDISIVLDLLLKIKPDIVFAAGDLSDPHGTHRMCLDAVFQALLRYRKKAGEMPTVWLYRGAWQEWEPHQIDMAVPISPAESYQKRHAIFRHESQKDRAMFPGPYDKREFWQRAEDRNQGTAEIYDKLGLPEYHGIEAFMKWDGHTGL
jgi:glucosamine-6-phosphate deaminase